MGDASPTRSARDTGNLRRHWQHIAPRQHRIRFADQGTLFGKDIVYGNHHNNPTVEDLWNTVRLGAIRSPVRELRIRRCDPAHRRRLAGQVIGGEAYTMWNNLLYVEFGGYRSCRTKSRTPWAKCRAANSRSTDLRPIRRVDVQQQLGYDYRSLGTYGIVANVYPGRVQSNGTDHSPIWDSMPPISTWQRTTISSRPMPTTSTRSRT